MKDENIYCLMPHTTISSDIEKLNSENIKVFIEPSLTTIMDAIEKKLIKAYENGELKDFKFMQFRVETNFLKKIDYTVI